MIWKRKKLFQLNRSFILWTLFLFTFLVVINLALIFLAFSNWSGRFTGEGTNKYNRGVEYINLVEQFEKQKSLAWIGVLTYSSGAVVELTLKDKNQLPIQGKRVVLTAKHSSNPEMDMEMDMESSEGGIYRAVIGKNGLWYLDVKVKEGNELIFLIQDRVILDNAF